MRGHRDRPDKATTRNAAISRKSRSARIATPMVATGMCIGTRITCAAGGDGKEQERSLRLTGDRSNDCVGKGSRHGSAHGARQVRQRSKPRKSLREKYHARHRFRDSRRTRRFLYALSPNGLVARRCASRTPGSESDAVQVGGARAAKKYDCHEVSTSRLRPSRPGPSRRFHQSQRPPKHAVVGESGGYNVNARAGPRGNLTPKLDA